MEPANAPDFVSSDEVPSPNKIAVSYNDYEQKHTIFPFKT